MLDAPALTRHHTYCVLSGLQPVAFKVDPDILFAIAYNWEEQHVHEVLQPSLHEGPPVINLPQQGVSQVKKLDTLYFLSHLAQ